MNDHPISIDMLEEGHLLLLGTTGAGKTYQQRGFLERLRRADRRVGAVDKLGNHWGLTLSADGKRPGLDFVIFGGKRAQVPMTPGDGEQLGRLFVTRNVPAIFDVSQWKVDEQQQWIADFADAVFLHNDGALHLGLDEAQSWVPQGGGGDAFRSVLRLAEQGRGNGIRLMMAAQRLSRIDKSAAGMAAIVVAMRQTGTADRKAMRDLLAANTDDMARIEAELPGLPTGSAFVWDPLKATLERHGFPPNTTFDSSRTPRHGDREPAPVAVSSELVAELRAALAPPADVDDAPDDPAAVNSRDATADAMLADRDRRILELESGLAARERAVDAYRRHLTTELTFVITRLQRERDAMNEQLLGMLEGSRPRRPLEQGGTEAGSQGAGSSPLATSRTKQADADAARNASSDTSSDRGHPAPDDAPPAPLSGGASINPSDADLRALAPLAACAPLGLTEGAWAARAGRARKGGAWIRTRKRLVDAQLLEARGDQWHATDAGVAAAGVHVPDMPAPGLALVKWWSDRVGAAGRILQLLAAVEPKALTREAIAAEVRMAPKGGAFIRYVAELKKAELIVEQGKRLTIASSLLEASQ